MDQTASLVHRGALARPQAARAGGAGWVAALYLLIAACTPATQGARMFESPAPPRFEDDAFISFDGATLGLSNWPAETSTPHTVVVGVHGMNDYAGAFRWIAPWMAQRGVAIYAYDQRGFGRSPNWGIWPDEAVMIADLRAAVDAAKRRHPDAQIAVIGISMGAAVAMAAFGSDAPPAADLLVLSSPGLRGWGALPISYRVSLWASARVRPGWVVRPPKGIKITPTDNNDVLRTQWEDPLVQKTNRIDSVHGVVSIMETAHKRAANLPDGTPTLLLYGARDEVIPEVGVRRTLERLPDHVRTLYYENGYHMLLRDLQRDVVWGDIEAFLKDPIAPPPSGAGPPPFGPKA